MQRWRQGRTKSTDSLVLHQRARAGERDPSSARIPRLSTKMEFFMEEALQESFNLKWRSESKFGAREATQSQVGLRNTIK